MGTIKSVRDEGRTIDGTFRKVFMRIGRILFHLRRVQLAGCKPGKILVVKTHAVGDVLLTTPAIQAIRSRFPGAELHLLVCDQVRDVVETNPNIDEIISFDSRLIVRRVLSDWIRIVRKIIFIRIRR